MTQSIAGLGAKIPSSTTVISPALMESAGALGDVAMAYAPSVARAAPAVSAQDSSPLEQRTQANGSPFSELPPLIEGTPFEPHLADGSTRIKGSAGPLSRSRAATRRRLVDTTAAGPKGTQRASPSSTCGNSDYEALRFERRRHSRRGVEGRKRERL